LTVVRPPASAVSLAVRAVALLIALTAAPATPVLAESAPAFATPGACKETQLASGARARVCVPRDRWNGNLVVYAHGYVSPFAPLTFAGLQLPDGTDLPNLVQKLGFAFATTTYRQNGLAVLDGVDDVIDLVKAFPVLQHGPPARTYVTGVSDGGLIAVLAAEQYPELFEAAYATCGPVGSLLFQVNYVGDFRVLFDVYFPGLLPGSPVDIPPRVVAAWDAVHAPAIRAALRQSPARGRELLTVARVPFDVRDPATVVDATLDLLWQNVVGTNDARKKLGGSPYGNRLRWYTGSSNDVSLNLRVKRVDADLPALVKLQRHSPTGDLRVPLVTLHTTGDVVAPYAHELLYAAKARPSNRGRFLPLPILRYGHCEFTTSELLTGFALMLGAGNAAAPATGTVADAETSGAPEFAATSFSMR
jgi:pimeloyl-ACP methyl ester carboxylesterase